MAGSVNRRAISWLLGQLPELVASGVISSENARAIERHYQSAESRSNFGFVLLAIVGSALVGAGIILLIAHNWDELSRAARSIIAFLPLVIAQALGIFVLIRRNESRAWRESTAIFDVAAVATAISLISQTYQIQGSFADFMCVWLLLSIPIVYLFRTTVGAVAYVIGSVVWLFAKVDWRFSEPHQLFYWLFLLAIVPYCFALSRRDRSSGESTWLSIFLVGAAAIGLGFTAEATRANLGGVAFAGLCAGVYLYGLQLFQGSEEKRLHPLAFLGGLGIGITAITLSFEEMWHMTSESSWALHGPARATGIAIELFFPVVAIGLLVWSFLGRQRIAFSLIAGVMPVVAGLGWMVANLDPAATRANDTPYSLAAAVIFDAYALFLGIELIARGVRANSLVRANFGLLVIAALAISRFFDSDLGFVTRGLGFIIIGVGFLVANVILFKKRAVP